MVSDLETKLSLQWLRDEYDNLKCYRLKDISKRVRSIKDPIEEIEKYSYKYNIKIVGIPQSARYETAEKISELCIDLFNKLGATKVYRITNRQVHSIAPPAIIFKYTRRLAKDQVMDRKKNARNIIAVKFPY